MIRSVIKKRTPQLPQVSTASLPDIVFILLFFFMTVTIIDDTNLLVDNTLPVANQVTRIQKDDRIIEISIGKPKKQIGGILGTEPKIQLENQITDTKAIAPYVLQRLSEMSEANRAKAMVLLKVDKHVGMGMVLDVKKELQKVQVSKITYTTLEGDVLN